MNVEDHTPTIDEKLRTSFRAKVRFASIDSGDHGDTPVIAVVPLPPGSTEPEHLNGDHLPYLCIPEDRPQSVAGEGGLILVAVEGRDRRMAAAVSELFDPQSVVIGLMHVTWMPRTIDSPLGEGGLNNPEPGELLLYRGAREALVDTASELRAAGFDVSTHLREDKDPAQPLAGTILEQQPDLFVIGLGRHGAGIARRVLDAARVPVLFVRAR